MLVTAQLVLCALAPLASRRTHPPLLTAAAPTGVKQFDGAASAVFNNLRTPAALVAGAACLLPFVQISEGTLLGTGDLAFLSWSQLGNVIAAGGTLAAAGAMGMGVHGTWLVFLAFLLSRTLQASVRVFVWRPPWRSRGGICDV